MRMARPWWAIPGLFYWEFPFNRWHFVGRRWWLRFTVDVVYRLGFIRAGEAEAIRWRNFTWDFAEVQNERWQDAFDQGIIRGRRLQQEETNEAAEKFFSERRRERELENQE